LDVETTGKIVGISLGESKLIALDLRMKSYSDAIMLRKARTETCELAADKIHVTSSLEAASLKVHAGK